MLVNLDLGIVNEQCLENQPSPSLIRNNNKETIQNAVSFHHQAQFHCIILYIIWNLNDLLLKHALCVPLP